jgi:hypothetical protein
MSDLVGKVEKRPIKSWFTQDITNKWMNKGSERMSTTKKEGKMP